MSQTAIPCLLMRGGTSKGAFFDAADLPPDRETRDRVLLAVMGLAGQTPDRRPGRRPPADQQGGHRLAGLDAGCRPRLPVRPVAARQGHGRHHAQLRQHAGRRGALRARDRPGQGAGRDQRRFRVLTLQHRHGSATSPCSTPGGRGRATKVTRASTARRARRRRSPSTSSTPPARSARGLLPTGRVRDTVTVEGEGFDALHARCDLHRQRHAAGDLPGRGHRPHRLRKRGRTERRCRVEGEASSALRLAIAPHAMGLGDVTPKKPYPKMTLIARAARTAARLATRSIHPACVPRRHRRAGRRHRGHGLRARRLGVRRRGGGARGRDAKKVSVEHPTGEFSVELADWTRLESAERDPRRPAAHRAPA